MTGIQILSNSPISFPGLFGDWEITVSPVALPLGNGIYWYGIFIALGMLLAAWFCMKQAPKFGLAEDNVLDAVLIGIPAAIVGARLYYVLFYSSLFFNSEGQLDLGKVVAIWDGGLAIYGGVIAAFLGVFIYCRVKKIKFGALTDLCVMGLLIGQAIGRWGNFFNREAFGGVTTLPWRMRLWISSTYYVDVHPTFLYESLWNLVGLLLLYFIVNKARHFDGESTWFYFLWYGLGRFWIEGLREDSLYLFDWELFGEPIRVSQALSLVMVIVSAVMLLWNLRIRPHKREELLIEQVLARQQEEAAAQKEESAEKAEACEPETEQEKTEDEK